MKILCNGKSFEKVEPPAVDLSSEGVALRAEYLRHCAGRYLNGHLATGTGADMLEALAADRDRMHSELATRDATIAALREIILRPKDKTPASRQLLNLSEGLRDSAEEEVAEQAATIARLSAELEAAKDALKHIMAHDGGLGAIHVSVDVAHIARAALAKLSKGA